MSGASGSPSGRLLGSNPLSNGAAVTASAKVVQVTGANPVTDAQWKALFARMTACADNDERLALLDKEKVPYLFTSDQLWAMVNMTLSVKTRIAMIQHVGPRLIDPRAKATQFVGMFRYSEEKEKVEEVLKARTQAVMASKSMFRPQGLALVAEKPGAAPTGGGGLFAGMQRGLGGLGARPKPVDAAPAVPAAAPVTLLAPPVLPPPPTLAPMTPTGFNAASPASSSAAAATDRLAANYTGSSSPPKARATDGPQPELQLNWVPIIDSTSGQTYYYNTKTGESTWVAPLAFDSPVSKATKEELPEGWTVVKDPATGQRYYFCTKTGESTWDKPTVQKQPSSKKKSKEVQPSPLMQSQQQQQPEPSSAPKGKEKDKGKDKGKDKEKDKGKGKEKEKEKSKAKSPKAEAESKPQKKAAAPQHASLQEPEPETGVLQAGWVAAVDPASGNTYYVNKTLGLSRWDRPVLEPVQVSAPPPPPPLAPTLPSGWVLMVDPSSGQEYYYNARKNISQWERPN